jgi:hypothetical protein
MFAQGLKDVIIVCGHYGCGKTNLSLNLALDLAAAGESVTLIDLDIVNPYFRAGDHSADLAARGIRVIGPNFVNTNLDLPSLSAAIAPAIRGTGRIVVDVGGDDAGATALACFSSAISEREYDMLYVINMYRTFTETPGDAAAMLREIERASRLKATGVVNNSHLKAETVPGTIEASSEYAELTSEMLGLPLLTTAVPRSLASDIQIMPAYPVDVIVKTSWE